MIQKTIIMASSLVAFLLSNFVFVEAKAQEWIREKVYVETPIDTDGDSIQDRIYLSLSRPAGKEKIASTITISPYRFSNSGLNFHNVDVEFLPQELRLLFSFFEFSLSKIRKQDFDLNLDVLLMKYLDQKKYAFLSADSIGTGYSTGCPSVGGYSEALGGKAIVDWLNGRAKAYYLDGREAKADWSNGRAVMSGVSYSGTLPIMVAATGVDGLRAIIPVAAISNWYNYYRSNGLVVNPGGFVGEDIDILGKYIVRSGTCQNQIDELTQSMGRETGDYTSFWKERNYLNRVKNFKAATFIIHGQKDWNVKQKQATDLFVALKNVVPVKMFLHRYGHRSTNDHEVPRKSSQWIEHFVYGVDNGIENEPRVEVENADGSLVSQNHWPYERSKKVRYFLSSDSSLSPSAGSPSIAKVIDRGRNLMLKDMLRDISSATSDRLVFAGPVFSENKIISGAAKLSLSLALQNRTAANISAALVEWKANGDKSVITRGWADPQNNRTLSLGEPLVKGKFYDLSFTLEPKQYLVSLGSRLVLVVFSTDFEFTLRPKEGTELSFELGKKSYLDLRI